MTKCEKKVTRKNCAVVKHLQRDIVDNEWQRICTVIAPKGVGSFIGISVKAKVSESEKLKPYDLMVVNKTTGHKVFRTTRVEAEINAFYSDKSVSSKEANEYEMSIRAYPGLTAAKLSVVKASFESLVWTR